MTRIKQMNMNKQTDISKNQLDTIKGLQKSADARTMSDSVTYPSVVEGKSNHHGSLTTAHMSYEVMNI